MPAADYAGMVGDRREAAGPSGAYLDNSDN